MKTALNFAAFYLGWFACALGAAHGLPVAGPLIIAILLGVHLFFLSAQPVREAMLIGSAGVIGTGIDSLLMSNGVYTFTDHPASGVCPVWITSLWMIFASTFEHALSWLRKRYVLASLLGALGGPLSYAAGARLGAVILPDQATGSLAVLAVIWGTALPALLWLTDRLLEASNRSKAVVSSLLVFLLLGLPFAHASQTLEIEGVQFAQQYQTTDRSLSLRGYGLLRYMIFSKAADFAIWLGPKALDDSLKDKLLGTP